MSCLLYLCVLIKFSSKIPSWVDGHNRKSYLPMMQCSTQLSQSHTELMQIEQVYTLLHYVHNCYEAWWDDMNIYSEEMAIFSRLPSDPFLCVHSKACIARSWQTSFPCHNIKTSAIFKHHWLNAREFHLTINCFMSKNKK